MWDDLRANVREIDGRIEEACRRSGRRRQEVTLVAISKTFPATAVDAAIAAGITDVGENRVQEFREKLESIQSRGRWHLVGHLQSNKVRGAVEIFDVIQSVDSLDLAQRISRIAVQEGRRPDVLLQVNIGMEPQKSGVSPDAAIEVAEELLGLEGITVRGMMCIPPVADAQEVRRYFAAMREVWEKTRSRGLIREPVLSMGMSDDFEIAVEEGSTMVRIGRAIFGRRE
ncbi:MAG: YggS family pyridoxal phosphate-dependent enzyme [Thermoanaerobaculia bacterium]